MAATQFSLYAEPNAIEAAIGARRPGMENSPLPRSPGEGAEPDAVTAPSQVTPGRWRRLSAYCITDGRHNICRVVVGGEDRFEVWDAKTRRCLERNIPTADAARAFCAGRPAKGGRNFEQLRKALKGGAHV